MSILDSIGNTPLVEIAKIHQGNKVRILAKLEGSNPAGSVKDRIAYYMIKKALAGGALTREKTVLEATSGNTGIGLAMVAAAYGLKLKLAMPECVSLERRRILEAFGAELVLTDPAQGTDGAIRRGREIFESNPDHYFLANQFDNGNNPLAHYETTGKEIWEQTAGQVTHFVAGMGTTGTLMGAGRRLRESNRSIQVIGVEPVIGHKIQGLKNMNESILPGIYDPDKLNRIITVQDEEAFQTARRLTVEEGIFVGMSSGAALAGALKLAPDLPAGSTIVTILPDRGERYLSTALFSSICAQCPP
jgi:S-sulfo-L-cysteine synthase (O-acetyl-L-serine-dependent)